MPVCGRLKNAVSSFIDSEQKSVCVCFKDLTCMIWAHKSLPSVSYSQYRTGQRVQVGTSYTAPMPIIADKYKYHESPQKPTFSQSPHFIHFVRLCACVCVCVRVCVCVFTNPIKRGPVRVGRVGSEDV